MQFLSLQVKMHSQCVINADGSAEIRSVLLLPASALEAKDWSES